MANRCFSASGGEEEDAAMASKAAPPTDNRQKTLAGNFKAR